MPSTIAWLDASREEQRRMREVVNLFSQTESRDELGIGQVRDAISDLLFPGTSTLHTRARYLLLIPWCYRAAAKRATDGEDLLRRAADNERRLILALNDAGAHDGLIGRNVLAQLKTLPSALYWSALTQWGIVVGEPADELDARDWRHEAEELVERAPKMWDVLPIPQGFPQSATTLDLDEDEARWVREKMLSGSAGSLLEVLLNSDEDWHELAAAWDVPTEHTDLAALLEHARLFSLVVEGAALAYNLAVARRHDELGLTQVHEPVQTYQDLLASWATDNTDDLARLATWDVDALWAIVLVQNPRISWGTRSFVDSWVGLLREGEDPASDRAVSLVAARERRQKGTQSRLINDKLLRSWSGASGTSRLAFRWGNVSRLLGDLRDGLDRAGS